MIVEQIKKLMKSDYTTPELRAALGGDVPTLNEWIKTGLVPVDQPGGPGRSAKFTGKGLVIAAVVKHCVFAGMSRNVVARVSCHLDKEWDRVAVRGDYAVCVTLPSNFRAPSSRHDTPAKVIDKTGIITGVFDPSSPDDLSAVLAFPTIPISIIIDLRPIVDSLASRIKRARRGSTSAA